MTGSTLKRHDLPFIAPSRLEWPTMMRILGAKERREGCDARVHWVREWAWCNRFAAYRREQQRLCEYHAGMVAGGTLPLGITPDGRWVNPRVEVVKVKAGVL